MIVIIIRKVPDTPHVEISTETSRERVIRRLTSSSVTVAGVGGVALMLCKRNDCGLEINIKIITVNTPSSSGTILWCYSGRHSEVILSLGKRDTR